MTRDFWTGEKNLPEVCGDCGANVVRDWYTYTLLEVGSEAGHKCNPRCFIPPAPPSPLARRINSARSRRLNALTRWPDAPPCDICGEWPCKREDNCPDFGAISERGLLYFPKQDRIETYEEAALRLTCGVTKAMPPASKMKVRVEGHAA